MSDLEQHSDDRFSLQPDPALAGQVPLGNAPAEVLTAEMAEPGSDSSAEQPPVFWVLLRELVETVVLSLIIFLLIRQVVQNYRIESRSMEPNFYDSEFILVNKLAYKLGEPGRGDVVVFNNPSNTEQDYIKRIVGIPGDTVMIQGGEVFVNGQMLNEPYVNRPTEPRTQVSTWVVEPNSLFVMGDNRPNSSDSRSFPEQLSQDLMVGKAWLRVWPFDRLGLVTHYDLEPGAAMPNAP